MVPKISVVLPVFNVETFIKQCIDSILNQTFQDFEIIVIDDCSTDNTLNLIKSYKDSRIIIITKDTNKGLIDSLNLGFEIARGKYIARMDGDDISNANRFKKQLKILENNPKIKACGCWLETFGTYSKIIKHKEFHEEIQAQLLISNPMSLGSVMLETSFFQNYKFDKAKVHVEDYDLWARTAWSCKFYNIQEVLYQHRVHNTQVSTLYKQTQIAGDIAIKLILFKKLSYNTKRFPDSLITKMLLLNQYIQINELILFNQWLKELILLNRKTGVYSQQEFENVLYSLRRSIIFTLYFKTTDIGINKKWRFQALFKLPLIETLYIIKLKSREIRKSLIKQNNSF